MATIVLLTPQDGTLNASHIKTCHRHNYHHATLCCRRQPPQHNSTTSAMTTSTTPVASTLQTGLSCIGARLRVSLRLRAGFLDSFHNCLSCIRARLRVSWRLRATTTDQPATHTSTTPTNNGTPLTTPTTWRHFTTCNATPNYLPLHPYHSTNDINTHTGIPPLQSLGATHHRPRF